MGDQPNPLPPPSPVPTLSAIHPQPTPGSQPTVQGLSGSVPAAPPPPPVLGRYRLEHRIGAGGMGEVYLARDTSLGRDVALKVMYAQNDSPTARKRFLTEASAMARLRHPNIVPVYDLGEEAGRLYFTMELVEGETLRGRIEREGRLDPRTALRIARDVALGLHHAHTHGIVHRDVKPDNILLSARADDPSDTRALVMDFGLARESTSARLTQEGMVVGTIQYLSPEQAVGAPDVGPLSDVYAIGATLYEALSGSPPFEGGTAAEVLVRIRDTEPPPLGSRVRDLPADVATLCEKAMAKSASRRYGSALELAADIDRYLRGEAILARPAGPFYRAWLGLKRHRVLSSALGTLLVVGVLLTTLHWMRPGTLALHISPSGARVTIGERSWVAREEPIRVDLTAGAHVLHVRLPDHVAEEREVLVERGQTKDVTVQLRHEQGTLDAEAEPRGSEIEVDGVVRGSRIRGLPIDTGLRRLRAWSDGCFEREAEVRVRPGETAGAYLWLESGVVWTQRKRHGFLGEGHLVPDLDGDGRVDLLTKDLHEIAVTRLADGRELWRAIVAESPYYHFVVEDLGGEVGRVVVLATDLPEGLVARCVRPRPPTNKALMWQYVGGASGATDIVAGRVLVLEDRNGDGVREVLAAGRSPRVVLLDGRQGTEIARADLPVRSPRVALMGDGRILFAGPTEAEEGPWTVGVADLGTGSIEWISPPDDVYVAGSEDVDNDGSREAWVIGPDGLSLLEGATGRSRWTRQTDVARREYAACDWTDLDGDKGLDALLSKERGGEAVSGRDGRLLWSTTRSWVREMRARPPLRLPDGSILAKDAASLAALDPRDGRELWTCPAEVVSASLVDWDGDDDPEIVVGLVSGGLACLEADGRRAWSLWFEQAVQPLGWAGDLDGDGLHEIAVQGARDTLGVVRGPRRLWSRRGQGAFLATPVVRDLDGDGHPEVVQIGAWGGGRHIVCLDGATGVERWSRREPCTPNRGPGVADLDGDGRPELLHVCSVTGAQRVMGLRGRDGAVVWECPIDSGDVYSAAMAVDLTGDHVPDCAFHRWTKQDVIAFDGAKRRELWRFSTASYAMGFVGFGDLDRDGLPDVVAPLLGEEVVALRGGDGTLLWRAPLASGSRCAPTVEDVNGDTVPDILIVSRQAVLWALDGRDGAALWSFRRPSTIEPWGRPSVMRPTRGPTIVVYAAGSAGVVALDVRSRGVVWEGPAGETVLASPAIGDIESDGRIELVLGTLDGDVIVVDLQTGERLWSCRVGADLIEAEPVLADLDGDSVLDIVVSDHGGEIHAIHGRRR